jgi:hypothetical protein
MMNLLAFLQQPGKAPATEVGSQFGHVHRLIESLPLTSGEYCFAHNWLSSGRKLWEAGEYATACYQVTAVAKKLNLLAKTSTPVTVLARA